MEIGAKVSFNEQLFHAKVSYTAFVYSQFGFEIFSTRNLAQMLLIKWY
jgi:hypothetical protein